MGQSTPSGYFEVEQILQSQHAVQHVVKEHDVFNTIETARLILRPWCADDLEELERLFADPDVRAGRLVPPERIGRSRRHVGGNKEKRQYQGVNRRQTPRIVSVVLKYHLLAYYSQII